MEMGSCAQIKAEESEKTELFRKAAGENLEIVEALRSDALEKCSSSMRLRSVVKAEPLDVIEAYPESPYQSDIKIECSSPDLAVFEEGTADTHNLDLPDVDMENAEPFSPASPEVDVKYEIIIGSSEPLNSKKSGPRPHLPYSILPETGHYKCNICSRKFPKYDTFRQHHNTVHLHLKYKCADCKKEFQHRGNYYRHRQRMHEKVKVKCNICSKLFPKGYIVDHRRETHGNRGKGSSKPNKKHACDLCGNEYKHSGSLRNHRRKDH